MDTPPAREQAAQSLMSLSPTQTVGKIAEINRGEVAAMTAGRNAEGDGSCLTTDHAILARLLDQLVEVVETGQSREVVDTVLAALTDYFEDHIRREWADHPALDTESPAARDRELAHLVRLIQKAYRTGNKSAPSEQDLLSLKKWLTGHIQVADKSKETLPDWIGEYPAPPAPSAEGGV